MPSEGEPPTDLDARLVEIVTRGGVLDLAGDERIDEAAMRSWDDSRTVRAGVIRDILGGRTVLAADPGGIRIRGARIAGRLNLENMIGLMWLELEACFLPEGIVARDAVLPGLFLDGCLIEHPTESALDADRLGVTSFISMAGTVLSTGASSPALSLSGAHVGGDLGCAGATLRSAEGSALFADSLRVDRDVGLGDGFEAVCDGEAIAVDLANAHISGRLNCSGGKLRSKSGTALYADGLEVDRDLSLANGFEAAGDGELPAVNLANAHISGRIYGSGGKLRSKSGAALYADSLQAGRDVDLGEGFEAFGGGAAAAVHLGNAHISGRLNCSGARLRAESGSALHADGLQVDRDLFLGDGFEAVSGGDGDAVHLSYAHIGGRLNCSGGRLRSRDGSALLADGLQVDQDILMRGDFVAVSRSAESVVRLRGGRVFGDLDCSGELRNELNPDTGAPIGPALDTDGLRIGRNLFLRDGFRAVGGGDAVVRIAEVRVAGVVAIDPAQVRNVEPGGARFMLDGLSYSGVPLHPPSVGEWLDLLREDPTFYAPQPYQHLAAAFRAAGQDSDVRKVLMAQRRQQVRSGSVAGWDARVWARVTGLTLGFGYQPWRALIGLLTVLAVAVLICVHTDDALARTKDSPAPGTACSTAERIGVGLDIGLPLIKTGTRSRCDITDTPAGQRVTTAGWLLQLLAWAFATLFIAGFTGAVRKT